MDTVCNSNGAKPAGGGTYKAIIGASWRVACTTANCQGGAAEHTDWPLQANTPYGRSDGVLVARTDASGIFPALSAAIVAVGQTYTVASWAGFSSDWRTSASVNCSNWTTNASMNYGEMFLPTQMGSSWRTSTGTTSDCTSSRRLICAEQ